MQGLAESLSLVASTTFRWAAVAFLVINGVAAAAVWISRDRRMVNRLTSPLLAANLLLVGAGVGVPALAMTMRMVVTAVAGDSPAATITGSSVELPGE